MSTDTDTNTDGQESAGEHVVVSARSMAQRGGFYHEAVFDGATFRALCGADRRMDRAVLARRSDVAGSGCGACTRVARARSSSSASSKDM